MTGPSNRRADIAAEISNCELIDNRIGLVSSHASANIHDIVIRDDEGRRLSTVRMTNILKDR